MAQLHYDAYHAPRQDSQAAAPVRVGAMVNLVGAILSIALLAGVGVWSYRLMVRDVSGIPVVRALEGPMRVSPADPGGRQAAYQGLAVNAVAAQGVTDAVAQEIVLAPVPVALTAEDRPLAPAASVPDASSSVEVVPMTVALQPVEPLELVPASVPGIARSPFPQPRPGSVARTRVAMLDAPTPGAGASDAQAEALLRELATRLAPSQHVDVDPRTLTPGTRLVQLGAYDDEPAARDAWEVLAARFPAHLDGRGRVIEPATSGGRTFYRLRAHGFADEPEARRFCAVLLAESADCIPVLIR